MMKKELSNKKIAGDGIEDILNTLSCYKKKIVMIFIFIIFLVSLIPIRVLLASNYKTGEYLKAWPIKHEEEFFIEYTHSVQLTPVSEIYFIDKEDHIVLKESYFHSYGAGLPSTTPYKFEITKKGFRIYDINEIMDNLIYRTGAVKANHKMNVKNKTYLFLSFSSPREGVKFTTEKFSILRYLTKEVKQWIIKR